MTTERYGQMLFSDDSITVFDPALDYDTDRFEITVEGKLTGFDRSRYETAHEIDVGAGADWPVIAYEVLRDFVPYSAIASVLFLGGKIEQSFLAWGRMASRLRSCLPDHSFTDATGASLLALEQVFEYTDNPDVTLIAYTWIDGEAELFTAPDKVKSAFDVIEKLREIEPREKQFGVGLHGPPTFLFKFDAGGTLLLVLVRKADVKLIEV